VRRRTNDPGKQATCFKAHCDECGHRTRVSTNQEHRRRSHEGARNITLTTRLVDTVTTPMLLKVVHSGKLQPSKLVTHRFALDDVMKAYDTFGNAAKEGALKVILKNQP
jgi:threonine dehydrogenase-like Zn-dependent dehydrogenase